MREKLISFNNLAQFFPVTSRTCASTLRGSTLFKDKLTGNIPARVG